MQRGEGPDETRRFPGGGPDADATRRSGGPPPAGGRPDADATRRLGGRGGPGGPVLGGRYQLAGLIGSGGMADVHRATDLRLNRPVAVKIFRPGTDPDGERRFHDEAQTLANLQHPGLIAVHDSGVEQQHAYLVMELVEGETLREVLEGEQLPLEEVTRIGVEVAQVLAHVHAQGVVHRDVKPSNVLLDRGGRVRLADFGISRLVGSSGMTSTDAAVGTVSYMSPEQVRGERVDPPADIYALGLVLLEAVTGRQEYAGNTWAAAAERLSHPPEVPTDLPNPLRRALGEMTDTDPARRPTARQVAEMLAAAEGPVEEEPARSTAARTAAIVVGVIALIAVLAGLVFAGGDDPSEEAQPEAPVTATEEPATEEPVAPDTTEPDTGADDAPDFEVPDLPEFSDLPEVPDLPDVTLPDVPDVPEVPDSVRDAGEDARGLWQRFTDWLSGLA